MAWACITDNTVKYIKGSDLADTAVFWLDRTDQLINLSGYTFTVRVQDEDGTEKIDPAKTTGIIGQAGSGTAPLGTPNLIISWANGELDSLDVGRYSLIVEAVSGGATRKLLLVLSIERPTKLNWSYTGDPANSTRDAVRFLVGDTDGDDPLLYDGEIDWLITNDNDPYATASKAAYAIASKFARLMNRSVGNLSADYSTKYRQYLELAASLDQQAKGQTIAPWASGYSKSIKETFATDFDREPIFGFKGQHDNPGTATELDYTRRYPWPQ